MSPQANGARCSHHSECFSDCCLINLDSGGAFCAPRARITMTCLPQVRPCPRGAAPAGTRVGMVQKRHRAAPAFFHPLLEASFPPSLPGKLLIVLQCTSRSLLQEPFPPWNSHTLGTHTLSTACISLICLPSVCCHHWSELCKSRIKAYSLWNPLPPSLVPAHSSCSTNVHRMNEYLYSNITAAEQVGRDLPIHPYHAAAMTEFLERSCPGRSTVLGLD